MGAPLELEMSCVPSARTSCVPHPRWKGIWRGTFEQLGGQVVGFDPKCSDISRLFYLPSRSAKAEKMGIKTDFRVRLITPRGATRRAA